MNTEFNSCNSIVPVASVCGLAGHVRAPSLPGRPRGSVSIDNIDVICMDHLERHVPPIEKHGFIEDNTAVPVIPPPPLIYEFDINEYYPRKHRKNYHAKLPVEFLVHDNDDSIISVRSVILFLIAVFIIGFIVFSPLVHRYL